MAHYDLVALLIAHGSQFCLRMVDIFSRYPYHRPDLVWAVGEIGDNLDQRLLHVHKVPQIVVWKRGILTYRHNGLFNEHVFQTLGVS